MFERLRQKWRVLKNAKPGERFQDFHRQREQSRRSPWKKPLVVGVGILISAAGAVMLFTPGPGIVMLLVGAGFLAQESILAARVLDWLEFRGRTLARWSMRLWKNSSLALKGVVLFVVALSAAAVGWGAFRLLLAP